MLQAGFTASLLKISWPWGVEEGPSSCHPQITCGKTGTENGGSGPWEQLRRRDEHLRGWVQGVHGWPGSITSPRVSLSHPLAQLGLWGCAGVGVYQRQLKAVVRCQVKHRGPGEALKPGWGPSNAISSLGFLYCCRLSCALEAGFSWGRAEQVIRVPPPPRPQLHSSPQLVPFLSETKITPISATLRPPQQVHAIESHIQTSSWAHLRGNRQQVHMQPWG